MKRSIVLRYGKEEVPFEYDDERFEIIQGSESGPALNDSELGHLFDSPVDSPPLEEIVGPGESVLIAVPDATREAGAGQVVNLLVRRLIANGTMPHEISVIFSTGLHRRVSSVEKKRILTPFIVQRVRTIDHDPHNLMGLVRVGESSAGLPIELHKSAVESDHVIIIGGIGFHYFAGFTGGRKLICPGLASKRTISGTHSLAFDGGSRGRAQGVGAGILHGNPVHEAFVEAAAKAAPSFAFNTRTDEAGGITSLFCGDWRTSHLKACEDHARENTAKLEERRDLVIVSCGGYPYDINLIQAHKALEMATLACREGGTIVFLAECSDGAGSGEFEEWLGLGSSRLVADRLSESYEVGGQTAWSLLKKAESFDIRIVTSLSADMTDKAGLKKESGLTDALAQVSRTGSGYVMPHGAKILPSAQ